MPTKGSSKELPLFNIYMEKPKIYLGINALSTVNSQVATGWIDLGVQLGMLSNKYHLIRHLNPRTSIDRMRNECAQNSLTFECDYLWFVDDDMILSDHTLESLIDADRDIVMARTYIRGYPFESMSFKKENERTVNGEDLFDLTNHTDEDLEGQGVVDCHAVGFACALIKVSLLKEMQPPYFITRPNSTEDIYFCLRALQEKGASIAVDCRVPTGHMLMPEFVNPRNAEALRRYYESTNPGLTRKRGPKREDRGEDYLGLVEELTKSKED